jgi:hypothetical protein
MATNYRAKLDHAPREVMPGVFAQVPGTATVNGVDLAGILCTVTLGLDMTADGIRAVSVTVTTDSGVPVTGTMLRALKVADLTRAVIPDVLMRGRSGRAGNDITITILPATLNDDRDRELVRLRGPVRESLEWAAWFYNVGLLAGVPPLRQVELGLGLPHSTASKWIARARAAGLIGTEKFIDGEHH